MAPEPRPQIFLDDVGNADWPKEVEDSTDALVEAAREEREARE